MQRQATSIPFDILVNLFFRHLIWEVASTTEKFGQAGYSFLAHYYTNSFFEVRRVM